MMRDHDRLDDGEPQAGPAASAGAPTLGPPEPVKHMIYGIFGQPWSVIANFENCVVLLPADREVNRRLRGGVDHRIASQVREDLRSWSGSACAITDVSADSRTWRAGAIARMSSAACLASTHKSTGPRRNFRQLIEVGEHEQILDEHSHPHRLALRFAPSLAPALPGARPRRDETARHSP